MALLAEVNRDPKKRSTPFRPHDFNPYAERRPSSGGMPIDRHTLPILVKLLCRRRRKECGL